MFDTMKTARTIKNARIAQNMTQMNLADAMEVSYQAVSNWERGNSMPDISKLDSLCQILHISMEELLGADSASKTLDKIIHSETIPDTEASAAPDPVTIEELREVAPLLPPNDMEKLLDSSLRQQPEEKQNLSAIIELAPFLDTDYLDKVVMNADLEHNINDIITLAPFLTCDTLDRLVMSADLKCDFDGIVALAPFLTRSTLNKLVHKLEENQITKEALRRLYPFLTQDILREIAEYLMKQG